MLKFWKYFPVNVYFFSGHFPKLLTSVLFFMYIFSILSQSIYEEEKLMDLSIREHIINNFKGDDYDTLRRAIDESVASQDEVTLPGLGVFLEIIWENADQELKNQLVDIIKKRVEKGLEAEKKEN